MIYGRQGFYSLKTTPEFLLIHRTVEVLYPEYPESCPCQPTSTEARTGHWEIVGQPKPPINAIVFIFIYLQQLPATAFAGLYGRKIACLNPTMILLCTSMTPRYSRKSQRTALVIGIMAQICLLLAGCLRDPNVRKQKFVEQGDRYFAQEKFPEALLTYGRALQIDPKFAHAHYTDA